MSITIGVNHTQSKKRIRFESISQRLQNINVDILHKVSVKTESKPDSGELGSLFQDELENCKKLETMKNFRR
jgi:hypothetical protein